MCNIDVIMSTVIYLALICVAIYFGITWLLPKIIGWVFIQKYRIKVRFGRISFPISLKDVNIEKNGFNIQINEINVRSSFFNSEVTKLLSIHVHDIRINKDINTKKNLISQQSTDQYYDNGGKRKSRTNIDFREKKVPPSIITFAQFMAVHVHNLSVILMNNDVDSSCFLHATVGYIHLDGSILQNAKSLIVTAAIQEVQAKLLRQYPSKVKKQDNNVAPCLMELSFGISLEGSLIAQGPISLERIQLSMNNTKTIIHGGLFDFIREANSKKYHVPSSPRIKKEFKHRDNDNLYLCIAPIIPKSFQFKIDNAVVSAVKNYGVNDFESRLQSFAVSGKFSSKTVTNNCKLPTLYMGIQAEQLEIDSHQEKVLFIELLALDSKLEKDILNLYLKLKTFRVVYNHADIHSWFSKNLMPRRQEMRLRQQAAVVLPDITNNYSESVGTSEPRNFFEWLISNIIIKGCAELWNISTVAYIYDSTAYVNLTHMKLVLEQYEEIRSNNYRNNVCNMILSNRHWSTELLVESLWCGLVNMDEKSVHLKKNHVRGCLFYLGVCLFKLFSYGNTTKLEFSVHTLRTEFSDLLAKLVSNLEVCAIEYGYTRKQNIPKDTFTYKKEKNSVQFLISAKMSDIKVFLMNKFDSCFVFAANEISIHRTQMMIFKVSNLQGAILYDMHSVSGSTLNIGNFNDIILNVKAIKVEQKVENSNEAVNNVTVTVYNDNDLMWNSNMHMHFLMLSNEIKEVKSIISPSKQESVQPIFHSERNLSKKPLNLVVLAEGNTTLGIKISENHSMQIFVENFCLTNKSFIHLSTSNIFINVDGSHIFTFSELVFKTMAELNALTQERSHYEKFQLSKNSVWTISLEHVKAIFPYNHDFSEACQQDFVSLFKWLKKVHNVKKKAFTIDSPLPRDFYIQINELLMELSDDPFEVKLRDNYVLLVDEYHEFLVRQKLFENEIEKRFAGRLVPASTLNELRDKLMEANSNVYITRSKKIKETVPTRTRLVAWLMTDIEIMALADTSIHGTENAVNMLREIDADSPWPDEGLDFVTLWCRAVNVSCVEWKLMLRDFPQPMFYVKQMRLFGYLCGAEQIAPARARRDVKIEIGEPFGVDTIQRGMTPLKFYHDFDCELESCNYAFGPCWEPVMAQINLSFEKISAPSRDPSPVLPFWDKIRLLLHGRLTVIVRQFSVLLHASLDPYNTTEEMELTWNDCGIVWTNAKIMFKGELNVCVRTASRYDDCRLLHFPNLKLTFKLNWICLANPNDHHTIIPCAPDKLPEYSSNQVHDSFRAIRSQNVNVSISFETRAVPDQPVEFDLPNLVLYGSTLRWFENLKFILSGVTRPTRRGRVFSNVRPRKLQLSRHYKKIHLQMSLHKFQVLYWMSHALHRGFELNGGRVTFSSEHTLNLHSIDDGLIHRQRTNWATMYMNCELNDAEIWLKSIINDKMDISIENLADDDSLKIVKFYFLSVAKVSYGRETMVSTGNIDNQQQRDSPVHKLVVYDLKGAWTKNNRDVAFTLFDSFMKAQKLKNNLSIEVLKGFRKDGSSTPLKSRRSLDGSSNSITPSIPVTTSTAATPSLAKQPSAAISMLQQLISESDHKFNVYSDDLSTQAKEQQLQGLRACNDEDVSQCNWFISLVNSQVLLKGCETSGYVILSAAKAEILQRQHRPVWRDRSLVSKTTWVGFLECMQYYATVSAGENDSLLDENIMWLTLDNIQEKDIDSTVIKEFPDLPHLVGSGQSVGGVVSETVGASGTLGIGEPHPIQLQRIVSRCKCEFFYVSYGDTSIDPGSLTEVPPPPAEEIISPWEKQDEPVDAFTLMHHDLIVYTNSLQYAMILDIVNNLLLYVEPQRKQALENLARMRFKWHLYSGEDQKRPIQHLQTQIRGLMSRLRSLEKDIHVIGKARAEEGDNEKLRTDFENVQDEIKHCKDALSRDSDELDMMLSCYKESQLSMINKMATVHKDKPVTVVRANEICFKHAQWRLTEADGQIGIADLMLSNFLYTKNSKSDDSVEHLLELGYIRMNNLIPRETFKEVLSPTEIQRDMPVDQKRVLRIFCREKPPVGGISVKEHFEINVVPITIAITKKFYSTMLKFCFPDRQDADADNDEMDDTTGSTASLKSTSSKKAAKTKNRKDSEFYVKIDKREKDDVDKMKERAEKNKLFIYIKIPEVPVRVSYKGNKEKNLEDIKDFSLVIPTLEYHNVTWTWLDLLLAMKSDSRKVILSQAIKQKLQIHRNRPLASTSERASPQEEDKAKMLFGNRHVNENKSKGKGVFKFPPKQ